MIGNGLSVLTDVPFDSLQLDPNNPRIAPGREAPGYHDADKLFDAEVQRALPDRVFKAYNAEKLEETIIDLGWAPVDPIIVWRHPDRPDVVVVVEGNTRTSILRRARTRLAAARTRLDKAREGGRQSLITEAEEEVAKLESLVHDTKIIRVQFVEVDTADELKDVLPRILGVRHVSGAKDWTPYATNIYISDLYEDFYFKAYPKERKLKLEPGIIEKAAKVFSLRPDDARRRIQAASAFDHFKSRFEDRVREAGNEFDDSDQYFFVNILQSKHAREEMEFGKDDLELSAQSADALFQWAFSKPRKPGPNKNVFQIAEDIGSKGWQGLANYDSKNGTSFAKELDVENPQDAMEIEELVHRRNSHKRQISPIQTIASLIEAFEKLPAVNLATQGDMLEPMLVQVRDAAARFLEMINGGDGARGG